MLVLTRKKSEKIRIGPQVVITVVEIAGDRVRLGITAPTDVIITREELTPQWRGRKKEDNGLERPAS
jgi:carbon storage regulator